MCGRFTLRTQLSRLIEHFELDAEAVRQLPLFDARYNIAPTQEILVVRQFDRRRKPDMMRWGLVPSWSKDPKSGPPLINARSESLAEKPTFRVALRQRRCLIPADGFYEWQKVGAPKQPYYIHRSDGEPFAFAGLWEQWDRGPIIESCTIVTTAANSRLRQLHDRMPVILTPQDYAAWLNPDTDDPKLLAHLLAPAPDDEVAFQPISTRVNNVRNDDAACIEALS
jgi:putative SOS response-associated peptidase YedK